MNHKGHVGGLLRVWAEVGAWGCGFKPQSHRDTEVTWVFGEFWRDWLCPLGRVVALGGLGRELSERVEEEVVPVGQAL